MSFTSTAFIFVFLPVVLAVYYVVPVRAKNMVLLLFSLLFYAWGEPIYVLLLLFGTVVSYVFGRLIDRQNRAAAEEEAARDAKFPFSPEDAFDEPYSRTYSYAGGRADGFTDGYADGNANGYALSRADDNADSYAGGRTGSYADSYAGGRRAGNTHLKGAAAKAYRLTAAAVVIDLLILFFFKYCRALFGVIGRAAGADIPFPDLALPLGLSFYTLQEISYVVDICRGDAPAQKNFIRCALYLSFFPKLLCGPAVLYKDMEGQLAARKMSAAKLGRGAARFIAGLAKKVVLADTFGAVYAQVAALSTSSMSALTAWVGCISFGLQIYYDLGGYSDMACGLAGMFGFEFAENFRKPYCAQSIADFWGRWHITLNEWFRRYVYTPLCRAKSGITANVAGIMLMGLLLGMWHGAAWNYIAWGLYYGFLLVMEKYVWGVEVDRLPKAVRHIYTLVLVSLGWVIFFSPSLGYILRYFGAMAGLGLGFADTTAVYLVLTHWLFYLLGIVAALPAGTRFLQGLISRRKSRGGQYAAAAVLFFGMLLVSTAFLVTDTPADFIYFQF